MDDSSSLSRSCRSRWTALGLCLALALGLAGAGAPTSAQAAAKRPNVVLIMTDDQRFDEMTHMPATRRLLASRGTTFPYYFTSFPLCCPSRQTVYTGQLAHNHGVAGNFPPEGYGSLSEAQKRNTLQVWLQEAGYRTGHVGKYLNGYPGLDATAVPPGWDDWQGTIDQTSYDFFNFWINDNGSVDKFGDSQWTDGVWELSNRVDRREFPNYLSLRLAVFNLLIQNPSGATIGTTDRSRYIVDELANRAVDFVDDSASQRKPFFLEFAPPAPHREDLGENALYRGINPRVPPRYEDDVQSLAFEKRKNYDEADSSDKPPRIAALPRVGDASLPTLGQAPVPMKTMLERYHRGRAGSLMAADDAVERIVEAVRRSGQLDNTVFIFTSDNGWMMGEHRINGDKYVPYEESIRVPLIISGPRVPKGKRRKALTTNVDITSTILDATGAKAGRKQEGVSLLPVARTGRKPRSAVALEATRPLFVLPGFPYQWDQPYFGARTARWKFVRWSYTDAGKQVTFDELYDLKRDPYEMTNLASKARTKATRKRMLALAKRLKGCSGRSCVR